MLCHLASSESGVGPNQYCVLRSRITCSVTYLRIMHDISMQMDKASNALAQRLPVSVPRSFRTIADHTDVPRSTLHARARGRRSLEAKAQSQQYLTPSEEKAMVDLVLQMSDLGTPVCIKYIPSMFLSVTRGRSESDRPPKSPGKN